MIYPFKCPGCNKYIEVVRPVSECYLNEICTCGNVMKRVYTVPNVAIKFNGGYDNGLGKFFTSQQDKNNYLSRYRDENQGSSPTEIGNDKLKHIKPIRKPIELSPKVKRDAYNYLDSKGYK